MKWDAHIYLPELPSPQLTVVDPDEDVRYPSSSLCTIKGSGFHLLFSFVDLILPILLSPRHSFIFPFLPPCILLFRSLSLSLKRSHHVRFFSRYFVQPAHLNTDCTAFRECAFEGKLHSAAPQVMITSKERFRSIRQSQITSRGLTCLLLHIDFGSSAERQALQIQTRRQGSGC